MTYVFETKIGDKDVSVEYVLSSVSKDIKVVDMTVDGKFHRTNWMDKDALANLMDMLSDDWFDNYCMENPDFDAAMNGFGLD